jgi:MoaA/NifB/PqqE/SkfB family radical SAM enzyme
MNPGTSRNHRKFEMANDYPQHCSQPVSELVHIAPRRSPQASAPAEGDRCVPTQSTRLRVIHRMPTVHLGVSPACNLKCSYCSIEPVRTRDIRDDFLMRPEVRQRFRSLPPTHFYIGGGEPLMHQGTVEFVEEAPRYGHVASFDTNLTLSMKKLREIVARWSLDSLGVFNISHHLDQKTSLDYVLERALFLKELGLQLFVKYIGVPKDFDRIDSNMERLKSLGIGTVVTLLIGKSDGRTLPEEYTLAELEHLLRMVTTKIHGLQPFWGVETKGRLCRGGNDYVTINMDGKGSVYPCCHGSDVRFPIEESFFGGQPRELKKCNIPSCVGDYMFYAGVNGFYDETDELQRVVDGVSVPVGVDGVLAYIESIRAKGYEVVLKDRYLEFRRYWAERQVNRDYALSLV